MSVLIEEIEDCPITCFEGVGAGHLDEFARLGKAPIVGLLVYSEVHGAH